MATPLPLLFLKTKGIKVIRIKSTLSEKDKKQIFSILNELVDIYSDFYLTRNNIRIYIKENIEILFKLLNQGDKIIFDETGIAVIIGYAEKSSRKYVKILAQAEKTIDKLAKNINWNFSEELFMKIKKTNPLKNILLRNKWKFAGDRGKEILLKREQIEIIKKEKEYA